MKLYCSIFLRYRPNNRCFVILRFYPLKEGFSFFILGWFFISLSYNVTEWRWWLCNVWTHKILPVVGGTLLQKFSPFLFTILFKCPKLNVSLPLTCTLSTDLLVLVGYCLNICMMIQNCSFDVIMLLCVDLSFLLTEFLLNYTDKKMPF